MKFFLGLLDVFDQMHDFCQKKKYIGVSGVEGSSSVHKNQVRVRCLGFHIGVATRGMVRSTR